MRETKPSVSVILHFVHQKMPLVYSVVVVDYTGSLPVGWREIFKKLLLATGNVLQIANEVALRGGRGGAGGRSGFLPHKMKMIKEKLRGCSSGRKVGIPPLIFHVQKARQQLKRVNLS